LKATPLRVVIDASAGIQLLIEEEHTHAVTAVFARLDGEPPLALHVPDLFFIECANILLKWTRRTDRPADESQAHLADLGRLALIAAPTAGLMEDAFSLASQTGLTAYDACYLALAKRLDAVLLTVDADLLALHPFEGLPVLAPAAFLEGFMRQ
jgi:predicted nucleic acid-binding protein